MAGGIRLAALRSLLVRPIAAAPEHRCELCGTAVAEDHQHLVDTRSRQLLCVCAGCSTGPNRSSGPHDITSIRPVPPRLARQAPRRIGAADWATLDIPVDLVFIFVNSSLGRSVACYPGPAGATESLLPLDNWQSLVSANPWIGTIAPDVEALLVRRVDDGCECFVVPIDRCYELVGRIRSAWSGFGGGDRVRDELNVFFKHLIGPEGEPS